MEESMYYLIYKISNNINGKIYIGSHKTRDIDDGYMGSGKYLKYAQDKYGIRNFAKEILFVFDSPEAMYEKEAQLVNEEFISEENTYNLKLGGFGGWDYVNANPEKYLTRLESLWNNSQRRERLKLKYENVPEFREKVLSNALNALHIAHKNNPKGTFYGKLHSEETKKKMSESAKTTSAGSGNSQFGTMWITNGTENTKISKLDPIPEGWVKGRKINTAV